MQKVLLFIYILLIGIQANAQEIIMFDANTSLYPTMRAKLYAYDSNCLPIKLNNINDITIKDNNIPATIIDIKTSAYSATASSITLAFDISTNMSASDIEIAKTIGKSVNSALDVKSEASISAFSWENYLLIGFTDSKILLKDKINAISSGIGSATYGSAFITGFAGALTQSVKGKNAKSVIIISSGKLFESKDSLTIINYAKTNNIKIYAVIIGSSAQSALKKICESSGGICFDNINTKSEGAVCGLKLAEKIQNINYPELTWNAEYQCDTEISTATVGILNPKLESECKYQLPQDKKRYIEIQPKEIRFMDLPIGVKKDTTITITAKNGDFQITDIKSSSPNFSANPKSLVLQKGESKSIVISITPTDTIYEFAELTIENDKCSPFSLYCALSYSDLRKYNKTITLIKPNGGENFLVGSDTIIEWRGLLPSDTVKIEYSHDNGQTWKTLANKASGLRYVWKNVPKPSSNVCRMRITEYNDELDTITKLVNYNHVYAGAWSPTGETMAIWSNVKKIFILDSSEARIRYYIDEPDMIKTIGYSPDGKYIAFGGSRSINIRETESGIIVRTLTGHSDTINALVYTPDGKKILSAGKDKTIKVWDIESGTLLKSINAHSGSIHSLSICKSGEIFASSANDSSFKIWSGKDFALIKEQKNTSPIYTMCMSYKGEIIYYLSDSGSSKHAIYAYNIQNYTTICVHNDFKDDYSGNLISAPNSDTVGICNRHQACYIKKNANGNLYLVKASLNSSWAINLLAIKPNSLFVLCWRGGRDESTCEEGGAVEIYDLDLFTQYKRREYGGTYLQQIRYISFYPKNNSSLYYITNYVCNYPLSRFTWETNMPYVSKINNAEVYDWSGVYRKISDASLEIKYSKNGRYLYRLRQFDTTAWFNKYKYGLEIGDLLTYISDTIPYVYGIYSFPPLEDKVASWTIDSNVCIWEISSRQPIDTVMRGVKGLKYLSYTPDGSKLVIAADSLYVWNILGDTLQGKYNYKASFIEISPDGSKVALNGNPARIVDINTGVQLLSLQGHGGGVWQIRYSPSGKEVATCGDQTVKLWDSRTGALLRTFYGSTDTVYSLAFSPNGKLIAAGGLDCLLRLWNVVYRPPQRDSSDGLWTITGTKLSAKNVDMGKCIVKSAKDSVVNAFISNIGASPAIIKSIEIEGSQADRFAYGGIKLPFVIPANSSQAIKFSFMPDTLGVKSAVIRIGTSDTVHTVEIKGEGMPSLLEIINKKIDFGKVIVKDTAIIRNALILKNISSAPITISYSKHSYPNDKDFSTLKGGAPFTLNPGDTAKMDLMFIPSFEGQTSGVLEFGYNNLNSQIKIQLYGEGVYPSAGLANAAINFGIVLQKTNKDTIQASSLKNTSEYPLKVYDVKIKSSKSDYSILSGDSAFILQKGEVYKLNLRFSPTQLEYYNDSLEFVHNGRGGKTYLHLTGKGGDANGVPENATIDFGKTSVKTPKDSLNVAVIRNIGDLELIAEKKGLSKNQEFKLLKADSIVKLASNKIAKADIRFLPNTVGKYSDTLEYAHNGISPKSRIVLNGECVPINAVMIANVIDFGSVNAYDSKDSLNIPIIVNKGLAPIIVESLKVKSSKYNFAYLGSNKQTLYPNDTLKANIRFRPLQAKLYLDTLSVVIFGDNSIKEITLKGNAVEPAIKVLNPVINFGAIYANEYKDTIDVEVLKNNSTISASAIKAELPINSAFSLTKGAPPFSLDVNGIAKMNIRFSPKSPGVYDELLTIKYDKLNFVSVINLVGIAKGSKVDIVNKEIDFKKVKVNSYKDTILIATIKNSGKTLLTIKNAKISGSEFSLIDPFSQVSLLPDSVLRLSIRFSPLSAGAKLDSLVLEHDGENLASAIMLKGVGAQANAEILTNEIDFKTVKINEIKDTIKVKIVRNTGNAPLIISSALTQNGKFVIIEAIAPDSLDSDQTASISLRFNPKISGLIEDTLIINHNIGKSYIRLIGEGIDSKLELLKTKIDFGSALINTVKDSNDIIILKNIGKADLLIDSIKLNSSIFSITNFTSFNLSYNQTASVSLRFIPNSASEFTDSLIVYAKDTNWRIELAGKGIKKEFVYINKIIDFGACELNYKKDSLQIALIKNVGSTNIEFDSVYINQLYQDFTINSLDDFSLKPDDSKLCDISFKPSVISAQTANLVFKSGNDSAVIELKGYGKQSSECMIRAGEIGAKSGESVEIPIYLEGAKYMEYSGIDSFAISLSFNSTLLYPTNAKILKEYDGSFYIKIIAENKANEKNEIFRLKAKVATGNSESTLINIDSVEPIGGAAKINKQNGKFDLLGVCYEGGARLINPNGNPQIISVSPNPSSTKIEIVYDKTSSGKTNIYVCDASGAKALNILQKDEDAGKRKIEADISTLSSGVYFIILEENGKKASVKMEVLK